MYAFSHLAFIYFSPILQGSSVKWFLTQEKYFLALSELFLPFDWKHNTSGCGQNSFEKKKSVAVHIELRKRMHAHAHTKAISTFGDLKWRKSTAKKRIYSGSHYLSLVLLDAKNTSKKRPVTSLSLSCWHAPI